MNSTCSARNADLQDIAIALDRSPRNVGTGNQWDTAVGGVAILRSTHAMQATHRVLKSAICMTMRGVGRAIVGDKRYDFGAGQAIFAAAEVTCHCTVPTAGPTCPYLGLLLEIDRAYVQEVVDDLGIRPKLTNNDSASSPFVLDLSSHLLGCALRCVRLMDTPEAIPMLYPAIMREICYWLLTGPGSDQIVQTLMTSSHNRRVIQAVQHLRDKFSEPVCVEDLAGAAGMSPATFHRQFKSMTSMSPIQYQKQLRLLEARRLMFAGGRNVESVAFDVGYVSASQFSREYTRMFGKSPRHDISTWKFS
jgi:AraC-like DNA-binding protein